VRGGSLNMVGLCCQQGSLVLITTVIARSLGTSALGQYALAFAMLGVLGLLALSGLRASLTRFIATQLADGNAAAVRGTVRMCMSISVLSSFVISGLLVGLAPQIASLFHQSGLAGEIRVVAVALPGATIRDSALAATQGWRSQRAFTLIGSVYEPLARLVITVAALALGFGLAGAYFALLFDTWTSAAAAYIALRRRMATVISARRLFETRRILSFAVVSWGATMATSGLLWADTLLLGHFRPAADVGVYNVATRLATLAIFAMGPISMAFMPQFAHHFHRDERKHFAGIYTWATNWIVRLSLPAFVMMLVFPADLLRIFGASYAEGAKVTIILAIGQLVAAGTGPCGTALSMAGKVRLNMIDNIGALFLNVGLNLWWIPAHGITGAALAWCVSLIAINVAKYLQLYWLIAVSPFGTRTVKSFVAAASSAAAAVLVRVAVGPIAAEMVLGAIVVVAVYGAVCVALGLADDERQVVQMLVPKRMRSSRGRHRVMSPGQSVRRN
jgi:O-antigen/teichoic acid export membrane protein